jgi:alpha-beta hydrolase superfamily lysophospholipase
VITLICGAASPPEYWDKFIKKAKLKDYQIIELTNIATSDPATYLKNKINLNTDIILAHSLGGVYLLEYLTKYRLNPKTKVYIMSTSFSFKSWKTKAIVAFLIIAPKIGSKIFTKYAYFLKNEELSKLIKLYKNLNSLNIDKYFNIKHKINFIYGDIDVFIENRSKNIYKKFKNKEIHIIKGGKHNIIHQKHQVDTLINIVTSS